MKILRALIAGVGIAVLFPFALQAQALASFAAEVHGGAAVPASGFLGEADIGFGLGAGATYRLISGFDLYAAYTRQRFGLDGDPDLPGATLHLTDSGAVVGGRFTVAERRDRQLWVQGGVLLHQVAFGVRSGSMAASVSTDRATGFELGYGLVLRAAPGFALVPAMRYRRYSAELSVPDVGVMKDDVVNVSIDVGLRLGR